MSLPNKLTVGPLVDEGRGGVYDPRGVYAETFWLPVIGPTAWAAARRISALMPRTVVITTPDLATALGVGHQNHGILERALRRLDKFDLAVYDPDYAMLALRLWWPRVWTSSLERLPSALRLQHANPVLARPDRAPPPSPPAPEPPPGPSVVDLMANLERSLAAARPEASRR